MSSPLPFIALGLVGVALFSRSKVEPATVARPGMPIPLQAGVPYLFIVRLDKSDEDAVHVLDSKGVHDFELSPATNPPFWVRPGDPFPTRVLALRTTPNGNSTLMLGDGFYDIGRIEKLVRMDGRPILEPTGDV